jgi:hypothetical protein
MAKRYVLTYAGGFPALSEMLAHVEVTEHRDSAVYKVSCPFCMKPMAQASLSGKREEDHENRYECRVGHRLSLMPVSGGLPGWK